MPFCPEVVKILAAHTEGPGERGHRHRLFCLLMALVTRPRADQRYVIRIPVSVQTEFIEHRPIPVHVVSSAMTVPCIAQGQSAMFS